MARFSHDHLQTILAAVDSGSFEAAARALSITPSAVSQRVRAMEQQTGRVLLERSTPIRPTTAGEAGWQRWNPRSLVLDTVTDTVLRLAGERLRPVEHR